MVYPVQQSNGASSFSEQHQDAWDAGFLPPYLMRQGHGDHFESSQPPQRNASLISKISTTLTESIQNGVGKVLSLPQQGWNYIKETTKGAVELPGVLWDHAFGHHGQAVPSVMPLFAERGILSADLNDNRLPEVDGREFLPNIGFIASRDLTNQSFGPAYTKAPQEHH